MIIAVLVAVVGTSIAIAITIITINTIGLVSILQEGCYVFSCKNSGPTKSKLHR